MQIIKSPLKYQGSKLKLVPWIAEVSGYTPDKRWVEPFMGSGVVGFNINPTKAIFADVNPHVISLFNKIKNVSYFNESFRVSMKVLSHNLKRHGEEFYYEMRDSYNTHKHPNLLLFLNHTCFNGVMRFNRTGNFNVPFGKNKNKLTESYIEDLYNRLTELEKRMTDDWLFVDESFEKTILRCDKGDIIYCDPPYVNRNSSYFGNWTEDKERTLFDLLSQTKSRFVLSTWISTKKDHNPFIDELWGRFNVHEKQHRYNVGPSSENRYSVTEALITNF